METAEEDPFAALDILVKALSEMAKPYGYVVEAALDPRAPPALNIKRPDGEWMAMMCIMFPGNVCYSFLDKKSVAAALVSKYRSRPEWDANFFTSWEGLRFPGGSPEELALKAAVGVKAVLHSRALYK